MRENSRAKVPLNLQAAASQYALHSRTTGRIAQKIFPACRSRHGTFDLTVESEIGFRANDEETRKVLAMRFMMMVKSAERSAMPPQAMMDAIGKLCEEAMASGEMIETGGLAPTAAGTRVRLAGGKIHVTDGPSLAGLGRRDGDSPDLLDSGACSQEIVVAGSALELADQLLLTEWAASSSECQAR